jgi:choice-of-anchor A domain-containing protein
MADATCGASGSINNGSSDPDGDLVGCTQSPPGPYPLGETHVTLTCTDRAGNSSSCMSHVEVEDDSPPALSCPMDHTAECVGGAAVVAPGAATATDNCGATSVSPSGGPSTFPWGTTAVTYSATDASGNSTTCTSHVTVADTLAPQLQVIPGPSVITCSSEPYADPGATASDLCEGDLTGAITVSSNLDPTRVGDYTITYSVADGSGHVATAVRALSVRGTSLHLSDYNLFLLEDYTGGHDVVGKVAAGGNITLTDFAVGSGLPDSDISRTLVAGGNLTLSRGVIWGDAFYGGSYTTDPSVISFRGSMARGTPIDFAARFAELRGLSSRLAGIPANGTTTREGWGGLMLRGTSPSLNVFQVDASAFTGAKLLSIEAPAGSFVVVNIHGASATLTGFGHQLSGGIDEHGILYNFADATAINADGFGFGGTVLAPYAHITFNNGCWDGGIYAKSLTGNAEGHINPLSDRELCQ